MEYNTHRTSLHMPEYGRTIQSLIEYCRELETKKERTEMAKNLVRFLGERNPHLQEEEDSDHKLWDHLFILADYDLDIDAPFPMPKPEELHKKPKRLEYPSYDNEYKFYGKSILQLIDRAIQLKEGKEKEALVEVIANNMKKSYNVYNKEHVQDEVIFRHLKELSQNKLELDNLDSLEKSKIYYSSNNHRGKNHRNNSQKRNKNHRNKRN